MGASTLTDTIKDPGGNVVATSSGTTVNFRLMANGSPTPGFRVSDGVNVASLIVTAASTVGTISQALENNSNIVPTGTYYVAEILCPTSQGGTQEWALLSSSSVSPQSFHDALAAVIPAFTPITTVPTSVLVGNNSFSGTNQFNGNVYFRNGAPWVDAAAFGNDGTAIQNAETNVASGGVMYVSPGPSATYNISATITVSKDMDIVSLGAGGISLNWTGGASPMFNITGSARVRFFGFTFTNSGTGTAAISGASPQRPTIEYCKFVGGSAWSVAAVSFTGFGYAKIDRCEFEVAPAIHLTGIGTNLNIDNTVFDCITGVNPVVFVDADINNVTFGDGVTFNAQANCGTLWDNSTTTNTVQNLILRGEYDGNGLSTAGPTVVKARNVKDIHLGPANIHQFGSVGGSFVTLTNSVAWVEGITGQAINKPIAAITDTCSRAYPFVSNLTPNNTQGIISAAANNSGNLVSVVGTTSDLSVRLHWEQLNPGVPGVFFIQPKTTDSYQIANAFNADTDSGYPTLGQVVTLVYSNAVGGGIALTYSTSSGFSFSTGRGFASPSSGNRTSDTFVYDGSNCLQIGHNP